MSYPFQPKSSARLQVGQFWPIRFPNGGFACGMVLDVVKDSRREFLAGLIDWHGPKEPIAADIEGRQVVAQGVGHVKMILEGFGWITGGLAPEVASPTPMLWTEHLGGCDWGLFRGLELVARVSQDDAEGYPRRSTWGYNVINLLAAKNFNTQQAMVDNPAG